MSGIPWWSRILLGNYCSIDKTFNWYGWMELIRTFRIHCRPWCVFRHDGNVAKGRESRVVKDMPREGCSTVHALKLWLLDSPEPVFFRSVASSLSRVLESVSFTCWFFSSSPSPALSCGVEFISCIGIKNSAAARSCQRGKLLLQSA